MQFFFLIENILSFKDWQKEKPRNDDASDLP